jgi:hypothetical protein
MVVIVTGNVSDGRMLDSIMVLMDLGMSQRMMRLMSFMDSTGHARSLLMPMVMMSVGMRGMLVRRFMMGSAGT